MTTEKKGRQISKQQLELVAVKDEKSYGTAGKTLLPLTAKNLSLQEGDPLIGKPLTYTVFNAELITHIKGLTPGARFLADIEERDQANPEYGPNRNIVQVYVNGQPVSKPSARGGYSRGISAEEIDMQFRIAALNAAVAGAHGNPVTVEFVTEAAGRFYNWLRGERKAPAPSIPGPSSQARADAKAVTGQTEADKEFEKLGRPANDSPSVTRAELMKLEFANAGKFYEACLKYRSDLFNSKTAVDAELKGKYDLTSPQGRHEAWGRVVGLGVKKDES